MIHFLTALLLFAAPSPDAVVEVGRFDPADFPDLVILERRMPHGDMVRRVEEILDDKCSLEGQTKRTFDISVPFAMLLDERGVADTIVVAETGCEELETLVGRILLAQLERGDFEPTHGAGEQWYASEMNFAMGVQTEVAASDDPEKMICRAAQPVLGSRVKETRVCRTAAAWRQYWLDREQARRDIGAAAKCGNDSCKSF